VSWRPKEAVSRRSGVTRTEKVNPGSHRGRQSKAPARGEPGLLNSERWLRTADHQAIQGDREASTTPRARLWLGCNSHN
jgi:hypothetical protein